ncbi:hypothetical protein GCM10027168_26870 [Streptomyces capparidis]
MREEGVGWMRGGFRPAANADGRGAGTRHPARGRRLAVRRGPATALGDRWYTPGTARLGT